MSLFSKNIRFLREKLNIKQDVFEQIGIKKGTYSNYENGKTEPNIETLAKISKFLRIDLTTLICTDLSIQDNLGLLKKTNSEEENVHLNAHPNAHLTQKSDDNCAPNCNLSENSKIPNMSCTEKKDSDSSRKKKRFDGSGAVSVLKSNLEDSDFFTEVASPFQNSDSNELIKHLVDRLQEQSEEIGALKQEVRSLKNRLAQYAENAPDAQSARA